MWLAFSADSQQSYDVSVMEFAEHLQLSSELGSVRFLAAL